MDQGKATPSIPPAPSEELLLLHARAAPLNQDYQHDHKKHSGYDPDKHGIVHGFSPFMKWLRTSVRKTF